MLQSSVIVAYLRGHLMITSLLFFILPPTLTGLAGFLIQSSLRQPHTILWSRLVGSIIIFVGICVGLGTLASAGELGGPVALLVGILATLPVLMTGAWIAWSIPHWRKVVAPLVSLLIPAAFWLSIWQGDAQSPEQITQRHGDQIVQALESYYAAQHSYPAALADLVPGYVSTVPEAVTTQGMGWLYHTDSREYMLGYWHYPDKEAVILCRYRSASPAWNCAVTANTVQGWAPFHVVWTPVPEP